jgi:hypothetical protein
VDVVMSFERFRLKNVEEKGGDNDGSSTCFHVI